MPSPTPLERALAEMDYVLEQRTLEYEHEQRQRRLPKPITHSESQQIKERWRAAELLFMRSASTDDLRRWAEWRSVTPNK